MRQKYKQITVVLQRYLQEKEALQEALFWLTVGTLVSGLVLLVI